MFEYVGSLASPWHLKREGEVRAVAAVFFVKKVEVTCGRFDSSLLLSLRQWRPVVRSTTWTSTGLLECRLVL